MSKDHKEVLLFLQELNMGDYFDNFINNGINTKEKLLYLTNDNLKLLNIPYAHRFRILKKLKESKNLENMKKFLEKGKLSKIKLKKETSKYEEIIIPKEDDDKEVSHEEMRRTFTEAIYDFQKTHSSFYKSNTINNFHDEEGDISNDSNDDQEKEKKILVETGEYIENKETNKIKVKELLPLNSTKILCYFCLKVILRKDCIKKDDKLFCSNICFLNYEKENYITCKVCSKKLKKIESLPSFNQRNIYYCSLECLEQIEPERKLWIKKNLIDDEENTNKKPSLIYENQIDILDL
jgi:hypothetical protein